LPPKEIVAFDVLFYRFFEAALRFDVLEVARRMNYSGSDDDGEHFRCWLVGSGKKVYESALADLESLADGDHIQDDCWVWLGGSGQSAWESLGLPQRKYAVEWKRLGGRQFLGMAGERWDDEDEEEFRRRFPRLEAKYGHAW
jgi:hypothetical protein